MARACVTCCRLPSVAPAPNLANGAQRCFVRRPDATHLPMLVDRDVRAARRAPP